MGNVELSIEIKAPPEKIWEMLAFDRTIEWMGDMMTSAEYTSEVRIPEDKFKVGASAHARTHSGIEYDLEIIESIENEKMTSCSTGRITSVGTFSLKPTEAGTEVTYIMDSKWNSIIGKAFNKLIFSRSVKKDTKKGLEKLKSILEK